ncbi:MAG: hypothetical protein IJ752_03510 [Alphaproteobacteria bacterium]|nr:hypothetical protein [Alphaproteobacteria bacterium]
MRQKSRWYIYPVLLAVIGFGIFIAVYDIQIPKTTVEKDISYDRLQK